MTTNIRQRITDIVDLKKIEALKELKEKEQILTLETTNFIRRKVISNEFKFKFEKSKTALIQRTIELKKEFDLSLKDKLLKINGIIPIEKIEEARRLMNVSSKNMYFFQVKSGDKNKILALFGEEFTTGNDKVVLLKSFIGNESKIVTKEDILSNPNLIAVSTSNTTLPNLNLKALKEQEITINNLFETKTSNNDKNNKFKR